MRIPFVDVAWQHRQVWPSLQEAVATYLADPMCDPAESTQRLEDWFRKRFPGHEAVAVHSGHAAQFLILIAMGLGPGDEVITVPNTDLATTASISHTGASFVLADVQRDTHNLDSSQITRLITPRTKAIVPVHMYGNPADMDAISAIAQQHGLDVVDDATLALGALYQGRPIGTLGRASFFSFAPRKVVGSAGHGGMVVTADQALAQRVRMLRGYGLDPTIQELPMDQRLKQPGQYYLAEGYNMRIDGIQAAIVRIKLAKLDEWAHLRDQIADRYTQLLAEVPGITAPQVRPGDVHAWRNYVILVENRAAVRQHLIDKGIATSVLYTPPVHLSAVYQDRNLGLGSFPVAEWLGERVLNLPIYPGMPLDHVNEVAAELRLVVAHGRTSA